MGSKKAAPPPEAPPPPPEPKPEPAAEGRTAKGQNVDRNASRDAVSAEKAGRNNGVGGSSALGTSSQGKSSGLSVG